MTMKWGLGAAFAVASLAASAADVEWAGEGAYELGAEDTLTFSTDQTITTASTFTGSGTIRQTGGTLTLDYNPNSSDAPFRNFEGTISIEDASLTGLFILHGENTQEKYPFGENTTLRLSNGKITRLSAYSNGTNNTYLPAVELEEGTENTIENTTARSGGGLHLNWTKSLSGSGALTIKSNDRMSNFSGDNSSFTGALNLTGNSTQGANFSNTASVNADMSLTMTQKAPLKFNSAGTFAIGSLNVTAEKASVELVKSGTTLEIGAKDDSTIAVPFTTNPVTLIKNGDTTLTLTDATPFDEVSGSAVEIKAGTLVADGVDFTGATITSEEGATFSVGANGAAVPVGSAFGILKIADGAKLTIPAGDWEVGTTVPLFTYASLAEGTSLSSDTIAVTGLGGNAEVTFVVEAEGMLSAQVNLPTLVWSGSKTNWTDENAWQNADGTKTFTFTENDRVRIEARGTGTTNVVNLTGEVKPTRVTIESDDGCAVKLVGVEGATLAATEIVNNGTLILAGSLAVAETSLTGEGALEAEDAVTFASSLAQNLTVAEGARFTLTAAQKIASSVSGAGTIVLANGGTYSGLSSTTMAEFSGVLEVTDGVTLNPEMDMVDNDTNNRIFVPGSGSIRLNKGTIWGGGTAGVRFTSPIEVVAGTENTLSANVANLSIGSLTGSGALNVTIGSQRGVIFAGDNSEFEGTVRVTEIGNHRYPPETITSVSAGSDKALFRFEQNSNVNRGGWRTYTINVNNADGEALKFGALQQTGEEAKVFIAKTGTKIEVGARAGTDSVLNGQFENASVALTKVGADTCLTFGTNFVFTSGSTLALNEGFVGFNMPVDGLIADLTKAEVTMDASVGVRVFLTADQAAALDTTATYDLAKFASKPDVKPATTTVVDGVAATERPLTNWRARFVNVAADEEAGTDAYVALRYSYLAPGLTIVVR